MCMRSGRKPFDFFSELHVFERSTAPYTDPHPATSRSDHLSHTVSTLCSLQYSSKPAECRARFGVFIQTLYPCCAISFRHKTLYPPNINLRRIETCSAIATLWLHPHCLLGRVYILPNSCISEGVVRMGTESSTSTVEKAGRLLQTFSRTIMSAARALKALQCVLELGSRSYHLDSPIADFPGTDSTLDMMAGQSAT
ncbi:Uncharacterized protein HZ326_22748 [Fusarium oxysporum f. sp. albedinis]|nr:Uncharacterized protein HZ326_22748 [Fusarium oxysporum f. sp. albedinis]